MQLFLYPLLSFLIGSVPFGWIFGKMNGVDIREHGSGNIGATNVWRILGKKWGLPCFILDMLKGLVPVLLVSCLVQYKNHEPMVAISFLKNYRHDYPMLTAQIIQVLSGLCAILGHNFSPWVNFKGGKGIATSAGVLLGLMPAGTVLIIITWLIVFFITRYVSLASIMAAAVLPIISLWGSWYHGKIQDGTWNKPLFAFSLFAGIMAIWKHRTNIKRLREGTEHRFSKKSKS